MAAPPARQQRRQRARQAIELGRKALAQGLPYPPNEVAWLGAGVLLSRKIQEPHNANRASQAAELAVNLAERTLAPLAKDPTIECKRGCSYCCHTPVSASAPEVFAIARRLHSQRSANAYLSPDAVKERCATAATISIEQMLKQMAPCALLDDGVCGIYDSRPIVCRRVMSRSADACRRVFEGEEVLIPVVQEAVFRGKDVRLLWLGAILASGQRVATYELRSALAIALADPALEQRWLGGEDVFAGAHHVETRETLDPTAIEWARRITAVAA